jgi:TRAP-type mannitol/chloroaromatic compound transport system permease small subunit
VTAAERLAAGIDQFIDLVGLWTQELEWHLFVPICLIGMSYALRHGEHVRVDVLFASFSPRTKHAINAASAVIAMLFSLIVIWLSLGYVHQSWIINEGSANPGGLDYRYVIKAFIPIGFALLLVQSLSQAIRSFLAFRSS